MEKKYLLEIKKINKIFGNNRVVKDFSLNIEPGKFVTFLGPSGCGKTTVLRMLAGFYNVDSGEILLNGERIDNISPQKRNTPMVFQEYALFPHMNAYENIAYGLKVQQINKQEIKERVDEVLNLLNLKGLEKRYPNQLSGGQQQRVAIARALINNRELLLLDEPLSNLDAKLRENVRVELRQIQLKLGLSMIYVTHDQQEALSMSDMIIVMNGGLIQEIGSPRDIYYKPKTKFVAQFIGTTNFIEGKKEKIDDYYAIEYLGEMIKGNCKDDEAVDICYSIRPESIKIEKEKLIYHACLPANIKYSTFLGEKIRYFVEDKAGKEWIVDNFDCENEILSGECYLCIENGKAHYVV
ncbi:ABC transporter ATP-binding protein [Oceanivirga salmonicida]|uniref:ABC transporter ATP-binding protein n=1 Tax=Oceanivirga salmonicida TaxID=1769291 RepID=UPI0012E21010|nr:ABC transporter ATP-binding protein [Oceanivirga salmonicida]